MHGNQCMDSKLHLAFSSNHIEKLIFFKSIHAYIIIIASINKDIPQG